LCVVSFSAEYTVIVPVGFATVGAAAAVVFVAAVVANRGGVGGTQGEGEMTHVGGTPVVLSDPDSPAAVAMRGVADALAQRQHSLVGFSLGLTPARG